MREPDPMRILNARKMFKCGSFLASPLLRFQTILTSSCKLHFKKLKPKLSIRSNSINYCILIIFHLILPTSYEHTEAFSIFPRPHFYEWCFFFQGCCAR